MKTSPALDLAKFILPEELRFDVMHTRGWTRHLPPVVLCAVVAAVFPTHQLLSVLIAVVGIIAIAVNRTEGTVISSLHVTNDDIAVDGNLSKTFKASIKIPVASISSISWNPGRGNEPSGLFVWQGWSGRCVLPDVSEKQANEVRETIRSHFPHIAIEDNGEPRVLLRNDSGIATLRLETAESDKSTAA